MNLRFEAIAAGQKTYKSGKPCKKGHNGERYASTGGCIDCLKDKDNLRAAAVKAAKIAKNAAKFEGLEPYTVHIKRKYNHAVSDYCHILRYGTPELIEQCKAFIVMMKGEIKPLKVNKTLEGV